MTRRRRAAPGSVVLAGTMVLAAILLAATVGAPSAAHAQNRGSVELVAQSAWIDDGGVFDIQVRVAGAGPDSTVRILVHEPLGSRAELHAQLIPGGAPLLEIGPMPLSELQATSNEILALQIAIVGPRTAEPGRDLGDEDDPLPVLRTSGDSAVYPVEVLLERPDGSITDRLTTTLLELPRGLRSPPLQVVLIAPIDLGPGLTPTGEPVPSLETTTLDAWVDAMEIHPDAPVTLEIPAVGFDAIARAGTDLDEELVQRLGEVTTADQILPTAHVRLEDQAWLDAELHDELEALYDHGARVTADAVGFAPDAPVALLDRSMGADGLDWLVGQGIQGVITRSETLTPAPGAIEGAALDRQFLIPTEAGETVPALESDRLLQQHFGADGNPVLRANRLLADLTMIALQDPDRRRSAVIVAPEGWIPEPQFLNVALAGIERIPVIEGASPRAAFVSTDFAPDAGDGTIGPPLVRDLVPAEPTGLGPFRTEYNQAASAIASWATVLAADPESTRLLTDLLRIAADERIPAVDKSAYIDTVYRLIDEQKDSALITPAAETITLTGRETDLPLVVENQLADPVNVVLFLDSEKLAFPEGAEIPVTLQPGRNRIEIPIEVLASGDSPIRVQILSPDRAVLLDSSRVVVRSLSFSGVGIVIGAGSIAFLVLWWLRHSRPRRATLEPSPTG